MAAALRLRTRATGAHAALGVPMIHTTWSSPAAVAQSAPTTARGASDCRVTPREVNARRARRTPAQRSTTVVQAYVVRRKTQSCHHASSGSLGGAAEV